MPPKSKLEEGLVGQACEITRAFDAPRELVWRAWTEPALLAEWWGPRGFSNPVCEWNPRAGARLRVVMRGPNGVDYPMAGEFREVVASERLAFTAGAIDETGKTLFEQLLTVSFRESNGRTTVTVSSRVLRAAAGAERYLGGYEAGMTQSLEKLAPRLNHVADREIISRRTIDFPRERVFEALSDSKQLAQWWGPKGFTNTFEEFTLKPGGCWKLVMHGPDGKEFRTDKVVVDVVPPQRVVLRHEQIGHNFRLTIELADESGRTCITWRLLFDTVAECTPVRAIIVAANEQCFDRLETHLPNTVSGKQDAVR